MLVDVKGKREEDSLYKEICDYCEKNSTYFPSVSHFVNIACQEYLSKVKKNGV